MCIRDRRRNDQDNPPSAVSSERAQVLGRPLPTDPEGNCNIQSQHRFVRPGHLNIRTEVLSRPWMNEYDSVRQVLDAFSRCDHGNDADTICNECRANMEGSYFGIKTANPLLSKFCEELSF